MGLKDLCFDMCVSSSVEDGRLTIAALVHADNTFAVGQKDGCDRLVLP